MHKQSGKAMAPLAPRLKLADTLDRALTQEHVSAQKEERYVTDSNPDPIKEEMRFCDWAFARLGHVAVFSFTEGGFMLLAENGERTRGDTLAMALLAMLEAQGLDTRRLMYQGVGDESRAA